jgi:exonuclease VII large subunit
MPVTAKLSRKFYEKLGDDIANELVEWFNSVDATYRSDLRELNELNFARFDAKVEQRWAQLDAKLEHRLTQLDAKFEQRLTQFDAKLEQRVSELRAEIQVRVAEAKNELDGRINALRAEMQTAFARVDQRFAELETRLTKRLFGFWVAQAATTAGLVFGVVKLLGR